MPIHWTTAKQADLTYGNDPAKLIRATAFHEAGHAVVAYRFGKWIRDPGLSVDRERAGNGHAAIRGEFLMPLSKAPEGMVRPTLKRLRTECMEQLAGYAAEARAMGHRGLLGGGHDWDRAITLIRQVHECEENEAEATICLAFLPAVSRLLRDPVVWKTASSLAKALMTRGRLSGEEAQAMLERSKLRPVSITYWR